MKFQPLQMKRLLDLLRNKYFLVTVAFAIWMIFFDKNDIYSQYQYHQQLSKLKQERDFYQKETAQVAKDLDELTSNKAKLEKFAREKYLMKKDNEDIFVIVKEKKEDK
ncbi:FtsB family cell division protein [Mucilaginibacter straminoryzae]